MVNDVTECIFQILGIINKQIKQLMLLNSFNMMLLIQNFKNLQTLRTHHYIVLILKTNIETQISTVFQRICPIVATLYHTLN